MAVVYLPEDKRWSMLGQGIGDLVGTMVGQHLKQQDDMRVMSGVSQLAQQSAGDQSQQAELPQKVAQQYGYKGVAALQTYQKMLQQQLQSQLLQQRVPLVQAQTQLEQAKVQALPAQQQQAQEKGGLQIKKLQGEVAMQPAEYQAKLMRLQELNQQIQHITNLNAREPDEAARAANERQLSGLKVEQEKAAIDLAGTTPGPGGQLTPQQQAVATGGARAATDIAKQQTERQQRQAEKENTVTLPTDARRTVEGSARIAEGIKNVLKDVETNPRSVGGITAKIKALASETGYYQGDPLFQQQLSNTNQLVAQAATSQGGFMSAQRIALARTISPSVIKGKTQDIFEMNAQMTDIAAQLQNMDQNFGPQYRKEGLKSAQKDVQAVIDRTSTLWSTRRVDEKGRPLPERQQILFYNGKQVNPVTLQPVKGGLTELPTRETIDLGGGRTAVGDDVNKAARNAGMTPDEYVAAWKAQGAPAQSQ